MTWLVVLENDGDLKIAFKYQFSTKEKAEAYLVSYARNPEPYIDQMPYTREEGRQSPPPLHAVTADQLTDAEIVERFANSGVWDLEFHVIELPLGDDKQA